LHRNGEREKQPIISPTRRADPKVKFCPNPPISPCRRLISRQSRGRSSGRRASRRARQPGAQWSFSPSWPRPSVAKPGTGGVAVLLPWSSRRRLDVPNGPIAGGSDAMFSVASSGGLLPSRRWRSPPPTPRQGARRHVSRDAAPASARWLPGTGEEPSGGCGTPGWANVGRMQVRLWTDFVWEASS
jgi:hypothetical protein